MVDITIRLRDNRNGEPGKGGNSGRRLIDALREHPTFREEDFERILNLLRRYENKTIEAWQILGLFVYSKGSSCLSSDEDGTYNELTVFSLGQDANVHSTWINTHNCMGVVRMMDMVAGVAIQLEIGSRFDDGKNQYFLNYLLSKVFGGNLVGEIEVGNDSFWEMLLAFAFRHRLQEACKVGLFKEFRRAQYNDLRFRGKMDLDTHLRFNIPFRGRLAYEAHEITFDNPLNHLIRHAFERIARKWRAILSGSKEITDLRHQFDQNTPTWHHGGVLDCMRKNIRSVKQPYFRRYYEPLRKVSLAILRRFGAGLYGKAEEAEGIIFDGSWLWENYLWTLLQPLGFQHPDNKRQKGGWKILNKTFYPDFYYNSSELRIVLDAKYKGEDRGIEDIRQVLAYMFMSDAKHGGLIKPVQSTQSLSKNENIQCSGEWRGKWHDLFFCIPKASNPREYLIGISKAELDLKNAAVFRELPTSARLGS